MNEIVLPRTIKPFSYYNPTPQRPFFNELIPFISPVSCCQEEINRKEKIRKKTIQHITIFNKYLFGEIGSRSTDRLSRIYRNRYIVSIAGFHYFGLYILPGGCIDLFTRQYTQDSIETYLMVTNMDIYSAINVLEDFFQDLLSNKVQSEMWTFEDKPLIIPDNFFQNIHYVQYGVNLTASFIYRNRIGMAIGIANYVYYEFKGFIGCHYRMSWRKKNTGNLQFIEMLPETLPLFQQDIIDAFPLAKIVITNNENDAYSLQATHDQSSTVFTTCPGGIINLHNVDFSALRGRNIIICIDHNSLEIQQMPACIEKCRDYKVASLNLTFDYGQTYVSAEDFMKDPSVYGCDFIPAQDIQKFSRITQVGQRIPGSDIVRRTILHPIILAGYIVWLYADSKIGKSWMSIWITYAIAKGHVSLGKWKSFDPVEVLYVDSEMLTDDLDCNIRMVMKGFNDNSDIIPFKIFSAKAQPEGMIDILSEETQQVIESELKGVKLIVLDNLNTLIQNQVADVKHLMKWLFKLSKQGIAIIVVDHTTEKGDVQGSKAKNRFVNLMIKLEQHPTNKDCLIVSYPVARRLHGDDAEDFIIRKIPTEDSFSIEVAEDSEEPSAEDSIPKKDMIHKYAQALFFTKDRGESYVRAAALISVGKTTIGTYIKEKIPFLKGEDKLLFDREYERLRKEFGTSLCSIENSEE